MHAGRAARRQGRQDDKERTDRVAGGYRRNLALFTGMAMVLMLSAFASQAAALPQDPGPLPAQSLFKIENDSLGADDQPGQKDLNLQGIYSPAPGDLWVEWQWNVTSVSGGNTGDACALFDSGTLNGKVNFAVCVTIGGNPAAQIAASPRVYTCGDGKVDRCTSTYAQVPLLNNACVVQNPVPDPFAGVGSHKGTTDTRAICHIDLAAVGGSANSKLINTCSYPSQEPTSAPADCVLIPADAFLKIIKNASPIDETFSFTTSGSASCDITTVSGTGNCTVGIPSGTSFSVTEAAKTNWAVTGTPSCTNSTTNGSYDSATRTISNLKAASDATVTCTFTNVRQTGAIKVTKLHSGTTTTLNGAVFTIAGETGLTTSGSGTVCKEGLTIGQSYDVTETTPPVGYALASPATQSVAVTGAGTCASGAATATFNDPIVKGTINIHKEDGDGADLEGATFTLFTNNAPLGAPRGDSVADPITTLACTTDVNGDCTIFEVPLGDYWVVETVVPNGYIKAADKPVNVGLGTAPGTGDTDDLTFVDPAAPGTIIINKKGINGALPGATFTLYIDNAPTGGSLGLNDQATSNTCTSNGSGVCTLNDVQPGDYWLVETTTPAGYDTAPNESVNVPIGSSAGNGATVELEITDPVVPGTVNIHKTGIGGSDLNGATFTLYVDNPTVGGTRTDADTITTKTCTTAGAGVCSIENVAPGHYWVVETTVPDGYAAAPEQTVHVGTGATAHVGDVDSLTFADPVVNGKVTITKKDDANNALNGAEFTLYTDVSPFGGTRNQTNPDPITNPVKKCTTADDGTCEITNVAPGRYWVVETVTPAHYVTAADQAITVGLGNAPGVGDTVPVSVTNVRKDRVVVLVCSEGTDTLNPRDVTVNGVTKQSLAAGALNGSQQKALCDLGGASFGDIAGKPDVDALIELSKNSAP